MIQEKRIARRFSSRIGIVTADQDGLNFGFITDLSRQGAFIESEKVPQVGSPFSFVLSNGTARSNVSARVMRSRDAFLRGNPSGFGIHFEEIDTLGKAVRDDLLLSLMSTRHHVMWDTK